MPKTHTAERVVHSLKRNAYVFVRSLLAYEKAAEMVNGKVLEIGTGSGYGIETISKSCTEFITVDKINFELDKVKYPNTEFVQMTVPPLEKFNNNTFDYVFTFQVIEHIEDDRKLIDEIYRVLKPGGRLLITTPNIEKTLFRNPWHIREYTAKQLRDLISPPFEIEHYWGVFLQNNGLAYYEKNKKNVAFIKKIDIFNLEKSLPRKILQLPFDIGNRINRKLLYKKTAQDFEIKSSDFCINDVSSGCIDLFIVAKKQG